MKEIQLTQGQVALVDDDIFDYLNQWTWCYRKNKRCKTGYAMRNDGVKPYKKTVLMHRIIAGTPDGMETDHIDGNGLNNLSSNLRKCTHVQNTANRPAQRNNKTGLKGVFWNKQRSKWMGNIVVNGRQIYLGLFDAPEVAARAYDIAARRYYGEFAMVNYPGERKN